MSKVRCYPTLSEDMQACGLGTMLCIFGPGAIIASVTIGSSETVLASPGGVAFGYALLWCLLNRFLPIPLLVGWPLQVLNLVSGLFLTGWGLRSAFDFFTG